MKRKIEGYGRFVAKRPYIVLGIVLVLTLVCFIGASLVKTKGTSYKDMLPENVDEINTMNFIGDEFGLSAESITFVIETNPLYYESDEVRDIRDPRVAEYIDILEQKIRKTQGIVSVQGYPDILRGMNSGRLPKTKTRIIELMNKEIVINQTGLNLPETLSRVSEGLKGIEQGIETQAQITSGLSSGLNASYQGLKQIQSVFSLLSSAMIQEETGGNEITQTIALINQIEYLVQASNATDTEKSEITGYLEILKQGLNAMASQMTEAEEQTTYLSQSMTGMSESLKGLSSGLEEMYNLSLVLENLTYGLGNGTAGISSALDGINQYLKFYASSQAHNKTIEFNPFDSYVSKDYTTTVIKIGLADMSEEKTKELVKELKQIVSETEKPAGIKTGITGGPVVTEEIRNQILPTMKTTSMLSLIGILIIVCLLFLSIRYGFISLLAIGFGVIWVYGVIGLSGISITSTMSGGLSMIMGIGIDFGIQVVNRFKQERKKHAPEKSLEITLSNVTFPMFVTTIAALVGFRAMSMGKLTILSDLGNMISLGVLACFIAAVTIIPAVLIINERLKNKK